MERMLLYEMSANGQDWTEQWLNLKDVEREREKGYLIRCSFCKKLDELKEVNDSVVMTPGKYVEVCVNLNGDKNKVIVGFGEDDVTQPFPMNYCPKCGRRVN